MVSVYPKILDICAHAFSKGKQINNPLDMWCIQNKTHFWKKVKNLLKKCLIRVGSFAGIEPWATSQTRCPSSVVTFVNVVKICSSLVSEDLSTHTEVLNSGFCPSVKYIPKISRLWPEVRIETYILRRFILPISTGFLLPFWHAR